MAEAFLPSGWRVPEAFLWRALSVVAFQEDSGTEYQKLIAPQRAQTTAWIGNDPAISLHSPHPWGLWRR
ncbi:MAG: hypothetical protein M8364_19470 [Methylobacter sp.]|uniref:hypothetical protein n=1 Tax=Methylobacter sp. TaxID=2051955 RepID=UPI0025902C88|nr:hypothetical protein [Methylobacter sp.]MCL7423075.1 hypothetical protein [Methylobacter sp.]